MDVRTQRHVDAFQNYPECVVMTDLRGRVIDSNPAAEAMFGRSSRELQGKALYELYAPEKSTEFSKRISEAISKKGFWEDRADFLKPDGSRVHCQVHYLPVRPAKGTPTSLIGVTRPFDGVLSEVHNRLRFNLQVVSSLLRVQEKVLVLPEAKSAVHVSGNRIHAVSLLHQVLEVRNGREYVEFGNYVRQLSQYLIRDFFPPQKPSSSKGKASDKRADRIRIEYLYDQPLQTEMRVSSSLCIVVNELLTNCIQHGFPGDRSGTIKIGLKQEGKKGELTISDNGVGVPAGFNLERKTGLGLQLAKSLLDQINAKLVKTDSPQTEFKVYFTTMLSN
ncbi:MAG: PAS domain-containing protein [Verrucomicrobiota bacterium]